MESLDQPEPRPMAIQAYEKQNKLNKMKTNRLVLRAASELKMINEDGGKHLQSGIETAALVFVRLLSEGAAPQMSHCSLQCAAPSPRLA